MIVLPSNAGPPTALTLIIRSPLWGPDLTVVSAVSLIVRRQNGTQATWAPAIVSATSARMVVQYVLAVGDLAGTGAYEIAPLLSVQGGQIPCFTVDMFVASPFDARPSFEDETWVAGSSRISPDSYGQRNTWAVVDSSLVTTYAANPLQPWLAIDLTTAPVAVNLWSAADGDVVALTDFRGKANVNNLTINGASGQSVPTLVGQYGPTAVLSAPGVYIRMKYCAALALWIPTW